MSEERLQKFMARCGVASRRASEDIIRQGRVKVDGETVSQPGTKIEPGAVQVTVDGRPIKPPDRVHYLVNKPEGYICSNDPVGDHPRAVDLVGHDSRRLYPVGRLDLNSSGLLIVTNDGDLTHRLTHPSFEVPRTYRATVTGTLTPETVARLEAGVRLEDGPSLPAKVGEVAPGGRRSRCTVTVREGRNRLIRRMFQAVGHTVERLRRIRLGPLELGDLEPGRFRRLTKTEVDALYRATGGESS